MMDAVEAYIINVAEIGIRPGAGLTKPLRLTNLYFLTSAGNKLHSLVRKSSLIRRKGFMKSAPVVVNAYFYLEGFCIFI